jgi:Flp pilus assembly protein TadD
MNAPDNDPIPALLQTLSRPGADAAASVRLLEDAVRKHPNDPRILLLLAGHRMARNDADGAEAAFTAALHLAPDFHIARFQLGLLQLTGGRPATAIATWAVLDRLPEDSYLRLFRDGLVMLVQDRLEDAERLLRAGIARNRENLPLNRDMEMVIGRFPHAATVAAAGAEIPEIEKPAEPTTAAHFLVSAYNKTN